MIQLSVLRLVLYGSSREEQGLRTKAYSEAHWLFEAKFTSVRLEADEKTCPILRFGVSFG